MPVRSPTRTANPAHVWNRMPYLDAPKNTDHAPSRLIKCLFYPALGAMLLMRHHLGVRLIRTSRLCVAGSVMAIYGFLASQVDPTARGMYLLGALTLTGGILHRIRRSQRQRAGENIHTYNMGCSYVALAARTMPGRGDRVERYLDPLICLSLGTAVWEVSRSISLWLLLSGVALFLVERHVYEIQRDYHDMLVKTATVVTPPPGVNTPGKRANSGHSSVIPAGVGKDISAQIAAGKQLNRP